MLLCIYAANCLGKAKETLKKAKREFFENEKYRKNFVKSIPLAFWEKTYANYIKDDRYEEVVELLKFLQTYDIKIKEEV